MLCQFGSGLLVIMENRSLGIAKQRVRRKDMKKRESDQKVCLMIEVQTSSLRTRKDITYFQIKEDAHKIWLTLTPREKQIWMQFSRQRKIKDPFQLFLEFYINHNGAVPRFRIIATVMHEQIKPLESNDSQKEA